MLRLPSNQRDYDDYWSGDPAFIQPSPLPDNPTDEQTAEWKKAFEEHAAKIKRARETGDWSPLLIEGQQPTKFVMQQIRGDQWRYLVDESTREDEHRMGPATFWQLMFRCACVSVKNLGIDVNDKPVKHRDLGLIAPADIPNLLDKIDASIVTELAGAAFERARNLNPL